MKVILLQELKGKGGEGDVVDVAPGFANNYLLPQKVAILATKGNLKQLEQRKHNIAKREENRLADAGKIKETLDGALVKVEAKVGEEGQLFGSVTAQMIADAIKAATDVDVDRRRIELGHAIKTAGQHEVTISLYRDIKTTVKLFVGGAGDEVAPAEAEAEVVEETIEEVAEAPAEPLNSSSGGIRSISRQRPNGRSRSETPFALYGARRGSLRFARTALFFPGCFM